MNTSLLSVDNVYKFLAFGGLAYTILYLRVLFVRYSRMKIEHARVSIIVGNLRPKMEKARGNPAKEENFDKLLEKAEIDTAKLASYVDVSSMITRYMEIIFFCVLPLMFLGFLGWLNGWS